MNSSGAATKHPAQLQTPKLPLQPPLHALKKLRCSRILYYDGARSASVTICFCRATVARCSKITGACRSKRTQLSSPRLCCHLRQQSLQVLPALGQSCKNCGEVSVTQVYYAGTDMCVHEGRRHRVSAAQLLSKCSRF